MISYRQKKYFNLFGFLILASIWGTSIHVACGQSITSEQGQFQNKTIVDLKIGRFQDGLLMWSDIAHKFKGEPFWDMPDFELKYEISDPKPLVRRVPRIPRPQMLFDWGLFKTDQVDHSESPLPGTPDFSRLSERLSEKGLKLGSPVFIRIFKEENELELWLKKGSRFELFETYPICYWSGGLGPKVRQGDRQAPEGFYTVNRSRLNPNSKFHLSFNLGYPNAFDRAHNRNGDFLMVHGHCVSIGCFAMTNPVITEIWKFAASALEGGQKNFHVHAYPFRMTDERLMQYFDSAWFDFWLNLKRGYDLFEDSKLPPLVSVCDKKYVIRRAPPGSIGNETVTADCSGDRES